MMTMSSYRQLIAPGSGLKRLWISVNELPYASTLIPTLFQPSSVENLVLLTDDTILGTELLPHGNTNLKELSISGRPSSPASCIDCEYHFTDLPVD